MLKKKYAKQQKSQSFQDFPSTSNQNVQKDYQSEYGKVQKPILFTHRMLKEKSNNSNSISARPLNQIKKFYNQVEDSDAKTLQRQHTNKSVAFAIDSSNSYTNSEDQFCERYQSRNLQDRSFADSDDMDLSFEGPNINQPMGSERMRQPKYVSFKKPEVVSQSHNSSISNVLKNYTQDKLSIKTLDKKCLSKKFGPPQRPDSPQVFPKNLKQSKHENLFQLKNKNTVWDVTQKHNENENEDEEKNLLPKQQAKAKVNLSLFKKEQSPSQIEFIFTKVKESLLRKFEEKKESIIQEQTWLESNLISDDSMRSIHDENNIDYNILYLKKSTFQALKSNYLVALSNDRKGVLNFLKPWFLKLKTYSMNMEDMKNKQKLGIKNRLKKSVSIINIQTFKSQQILQKMNGKQAKGPNSIEIQQLAYNKKKIKLDMYWKDLYRIQKIQEELVQKKINICKYNYSMDREVQNFDCENAILQLSSNGEMLNIFNSKLVDTIVVRKSAVLLDDSENAPQENKLKKEHEELYSDSEHFEESQKSDNEQFLQPEVKLVIQPSSASCSLSNIKSINFGGFSSRFWSLRKHIISSEFQYQSSINLPFYSWQCISLTLHNRDVDLVIKNERMQNNLVKYLLYKLETLDGNAGSAKKLIQMMDAQQMESYLSKNKVQKKQDDFIRTLEIRIHLRNKLKVVQKTYLKYLILKFRQKVSFIAFKNKMTIVELFCNAIAKSYTKLVAEGTIQIDENQDKLQNELYMQMMEGYQVSSLFKQIMRIHYDKIQGSELWKMLEEEKRENDRKAMQSNYEIYNVVKKGIEKQVVIDNEYNAFVMAKVMKLCTKNNCVDLFKNSVVESSKGNQRYRMFEYKSNKQFFKDKRIKKEKIILLHKLKLVLGLKSLPGMLYVRALLQKIEISKQLFVMDVQDGQEVFVTKDLSQQQLPLSFRYYDPLILIVQERMTDESKDFYKLKNSLKKEIYSHIDTYTKILETLGLRQNKQNSSKNLTFKYKVVSEKEKDLIRIDDSVHTMGLQRSNYLQIDNELMHSLHNNPHKVIAMSKSHKKSTNNYIGFNPDEDIENVANNVYLKFCSSQEVNRKRQIFLLYKAQFLVKFMRLRNNGEKFLNVSRTYRWINENIDQLFANYKRNQHLYKNFDFFDPLNLIQKIRLASLTTENDKINSGVFKATQNDNNNFQITFRLDNKLEFIKNDAIKDEFIQKINIQQQKFEENEKERFRQYCYKQAEYLLMKRRDKIHSLRLNEIKKVMSKNNHYQDKITYIDNQIEREMTYYESSTNLGTIEFQRIKNQLKKVEQQIKINNQKKKK